MMARQPTTVLRPWLLSCSWKQQTVLLCALRGPDAGGSAEIKAAVRWIRRVTLENAAPRKTFMRDEGFPRLRDLAEERPLTFDMLPVHFLSHLMHALQVIGCQHPDPDTQDRAAEGYLDLCNYLHIRPERDADFRSRLADEIEPSGDGP